MVFIGTGQDELTIMRYFINGEEAIEINYGSGEYAHEVDSIYKKNLITGKSEYIGDEVQWIGDLEFIVLENGNLYEPNDKVSDHYDKDGNLIFK